MTRMQDLFASQRRRDERVINTIGNPATDRRLEDMFDGAPRVTAERPDVPDEVDALTDLIGGRRVAAPEPRGAKKPIRARRSRGRRDWLSIGAATLAVVSVVSASTMVGISVASASPATDALNTLTANEAVLANDIQRVNNSIATLEQSRQNAKAEAEALAAPLAGLAELGDIPAVATTEAARQTFLAEIETVEMPETVAAYRRPAIDGDSLESVGTAIDFVDSRTREAQTASSELDDIRRTLDQTVAPLDDAVAALGRDLPALATTLVEDNDLADETLRTNVTTLAARVSQVDTTTAPSAISEFLSAVTALRDGQEAAEEEIAAQAAAEAEERRQQLLREQREREQQLQQQQEEEQQQQEEEQEQPTTPPTTPTAPETTAPPADGTGGTGGSDTGSDGTGATPVTGG